jgi:hypothetical protein
MADPTRKFESETIALSGLKSVVEKTETGEIRSAGSRKSRHKEGRDKAQRKVIVLRLIEYFEQDPSGLGEP